MDPARATVQSESRGVEPNPAQAIGWRSSSSSSPASSRAGASAPSSSRYGEVALVMVQRDDLLLDGSLRHQTVDRSPGASGVSSLDVVMRQTHRAGEKLFVDYAGQSVPVVERTTGELRKAQIFVADASGRRTTRFAEATWTQALPDWCASHVRALRFFHGVPELVIPDNLANRRSPAPIASSPTLDPTYTDLAEHYRLRHPPRSGAPPSRQGQGRGRRSDRRALDPRRHCATAPSFSLMPSGQSRHRRAARMAQ